MKDSNKNRVKCMNKVIDRIEKRLKSHNLSDAVEIYWAEEHYAKNETVLFVRAEFIVENDFANQIQSYDIDDLYYELIEKENSKPASIAEELTNSVFYKLSRDIVNHCPDFKEEEDSVPNYDDDDYDENEDYDDGYDEENDYEEEFFVLDNDY